MSRPEQFSLFPTEIATEDRRMDSGKVDDHQRIQGIAKIRIDADSNEARVQPEILSEQNGNALAVCLESSDKLIRLFDRRRQNGGRRVRSLRLRVPRVNSLHKFRERSLEMILLQERDQQCMRRIRVACTDAHRTKQETIAGMLGDKAADPLPQEKKRIVVALILGTDER